MANKTKIILTGGGTLGSVMPLVALYQELIKQGNPADNFLWVGTQTGPEKNFINKYNIKFKTINSGKLRRYFSWQNVIDVFYLLVGFIESVVIMAVFKPDLIISAGSFVSVPVVWAGRLFGKKVIIHQQDLRLGLANKMMAPAANKITVTFEKSLSDFNKTKTVWVGNPVRGEITTIKNQLLTIKYYKKFDLTDERPILLVLGGGTGAINLNKIIIDSMPELLNYCQIIHLTGKGKLTTKKDFSGYRAYDFLHEELPLAMNLASVVISRAGMSALTELSYMEKPTIVIPIPDSHQEDNAKYFSDKEAVIYLKQKELTEEKLIDTVNYLLNNKEKREILGRNFKEAMMSGANQAMVKIIEGLMV